MSETDSDELNLGPIRSNLLALLYRAFLYLALVDSSVAMRIIYSVIFCWQDVFVHSQLLLLWNTPPED